MHSARRGAEAGGSARRLTRAATAAPNARAHTAPQRTRVLCRYTLCKNTGGDNPVPVFIFKCYGRGAVRTEPAETTMRLST